MIGYFKRLKEEREKREKTLTALAVSVNRLSESLSDLGEFREGLEEVLIEKLDEVCGEIREERKQLAELTVPLQQMLQAMYKYFEYELRQLKRMEEFEQKQPGKHDDVF